MSENGEIDGGGLEDAHPMEPDHEACYRAISTRDARFDGRIFTAVRATKGPGLAAVESVCRPASLDHGCSDKQSKHPHQP